jgi:hypothetical protein
MQREPGARAEVDLVGLDVLVEGELDFREAGITSGFDGIESRMFPGPSE